MKFVLSSQKNTPHIVNFFILTSYLLDHELEYQKGSAFEEDIIKEINLLKGKVKTYKELTEIINEKYKTYFKAAQIKYQATKLLQQTYGEPDKDAHNFVNLAKNEAINGGYFACDVNNSQQLFRTLFLSQTMLLYSKYFLDLVIIDATYKRNRFNLPLINVIGINNLGRNIMLAFGLVSNETTSSYEWFFSHLKKAWGNYKPKNFIIDGCEEMRKGKLIL